MSVLQDVKLKRQNLQIGEKVLVLHTMTSKFGFNNEGHLATHTHIYIRVIGALNELLVECGTKFYFK